MILPLSVAFSVHHTGFPGALTRKLHAVSPLMDLNLRPTMIASSPLNLLCRWIVMDNAEAVG
ncbi:MAG TPA: hypothetical protein VF043_35500 [Ktedonobacteraceae bacterium]